MKCNEFLTDKVEFEKVKFETKKGCSVAVHE